MLISVVVPSYNQAEFLDETLRSILSQDHAELEVIVVDGGSTDNSVEVIRRHAPRLAYWCSERDEGQSHAIAKGMALAKGDLVGWLNSDDVLMPGALKRVAEAAARTGHVNAVFHGGHKVIDEQGVVMELNRAVPELSWCTRRLGPVICQPGSFFGREAYRRVGGVDIALQYGMDLDLWLRFHSAGVPFVRVEGYLAGFRRHSKQKGHTLEFLRKCESEEALLRSRYGLAVPGTAAYRNARTLRRAIGVASGALLLTLGYRLVSRGTLREYHPSYS
jgi:glycosyltransferase involved in cell wall biosynthesis